MVLLVKISLNQVKCKTENWLRAKIYQTNKMEQRINKLQQTLASGKMDALIVTNPANIYYLTGINNFDSEKGFLLVIAENDWKIITSRFYQNRVETAVSQNRVVYVERGDSMSKNAATFIGDRLRVGFERGDVSYAQFEVFKTAFRKKKLVPAGGFIEQMRQIKDETELALIKKAAAITDKTFAQVLPLIKPGVTELQLKRKITEIMQDLGASGGSFDPIVASSKYAADPHYEGANKKIKTGEMIVIDMGARYKNYDADMTRMVFVGKATEKYRRLYQIVAETQELALKDCVLGTPLSQAFDNCVANFRKYGEDEYFTHGLGHGTGIEIHEEPSLSPSGMGSFENGMVFTVEPGLYHPGWGGIRIEDLCAMVGGKTVILSKTPKRLIEIK